MCSLLFCPRIKAYALSLQLICILALGITTSSHAQHRGMMLATGGDNVAMLRTIQDLRGFGATCVRYPIYLGWQPDLEAWINQIRFIQPYMSSQRMTLIIDLHQPNRGLPQAGTQILDQAQFERDWIRIATAVGNRADVWLDLLNEPAIPMSVWRPIAQRTAERIRRVNQKSPIVFAAPGADVSTHINSLRPLDGISNQVLQLHFWNWAGGSSLTSDVQSVWSPIPYPSPARGRTKERLEQLLDGVQALQTRTRTPVLIGEVGISANHPNAPRFLRDFTQAARQRGLHLVIHAFREADVWNYERNPQAWGIVSNWLRNP